MQYRRTKFSLNRWVLESENVFTQSNVAGGWSSNSKSATGQFGVYARKYQQQSIRRAQSPRCDLLPHRK